jgi:glycosyltransferase involved in cell wall biosynthesis
MPFNAPKSIYNYLTMTKENTPYLSIIFPAHNEETRLLDALTSVDGYLKKKAFAAEVLVIENASTDATLAIAREFAASHPYVTVLHSDVPGKGLAVQQGMLAARGEYRFVCDVDLSMPVEEIDKFLPAGGMNYDVAIASREAKGAVRHEEPLYRHLIGRVFNGLVQMLVLPDLNDTQCGFKCFSAAAAETLFSRMTIPGWTFDVEILAVARSMKMKIVEVPIHWYYHEHSKVHVLRDSLRMALDLLIIRKNLRRGTYANPH